MSRDVIVGSFVPPQRGKPRRGGESRGRSPLAPAAEARESRGQSPLASDLHFWAQPDAFLLRLARG